MFAHWRHVRPGIEDVRDAVLLQNGEVLRVQEILVPDLHAVRPTGGQLAEESVEIGHEVPAMLVIARIEF